MMNNKKKHLPTDIKAVLTHYAINFTHVEISTLGNGHINQTYKVTTPTLAFVLQKINHQVFTKTVELFSNTQKINNHLTKQKNINNYDFFVAKQIPTNTEKTYCKVGDNYWRLMDFIPNSKTIETVTSTVQAAQIAGAFAHFSYALSDFNVDELNIMIDNFHDINFRLKQLKKAVQQDKYKRLASCQSLVDYCFNQTAFIEHINIISKALPLHVTHNDTKINNLLFDNTERPCAVIDLDTCMPGFLMYDFGDMVRTCCSNLAEDDSNLDNMTLKLDIFHTLIQSYQSAFADKITASEKESLIVGAKLLPFMVGIRFLTDYLNGDSYFATVRENQNLDRAVNQLHMYKLLCQANDILVQLATTSKATPFP